MTTKDYLKVTIPFMLSTATQPLLGAANTAMMGRMPTACVPGTKKNRRSGH